jgi:hypothetical protein
MPALGVPPYSGIRKNAVSRAEEAELLHVIRIYTGEDGESHFEDLQIPESEDPGWKYTVSEVFPATAIHFTTSPSDYVSDYHTAPRRQFVIPLGGTVEFETGPGSTRLLSPGDVLLADDLTGRGHRSRGIDGPRHIIFVPIPGDLDISTWRAPSAGPRL